MSKDRDPMAPPFLMIIDPYKDPRLWWTLPPRERQAMEKAAAQQIKKRNSKKHKARAKKKRAPVTRRV